MENTLQRRVLAIVSPSAPHRWNLSISPLVALTKCLTNAVGGRKGPVGSPARGRVWWRKDSVRSLDGRCSGGKAMVARDEAAGHRAE